MYHLDEVLYQGLREQYANSNIRRTEINLASSGVDKDSLVTKKNMKDENKVYLVTGSGLCCGVIKGSHRNKS